MNENENEHLPSEEELKKELRNEIEKLIENGQVEQMDDEDIDYEIDEFCREIHVTHHVSASDWNTAIIVIILIFLFGC